MYQVPAVPLCIDADRITPVSSVRDLGVYLDSDLSMKTHMSRTVSSCFGVLRQIRSVRRSLPRHAVMSLVTSLVLTKLDYCNSVLAGLPMNLLNKLQAVIISAAELVCNRRRQNTFFTHHTVAERSSLAAHPKKDYFQTVCHGVQMPTQPGTSLSV